MTKDQTSSSAQLAQALLLEQVHYFKSQLCAEHSSEYLQHLSHLIFQSLQQLKLHQVIDMQQLEMVVRRYAFEMQLGADLLEFIGEISKQIYLSALKSPSTLNDLVSDQQFDIWLAKFLELDNIRLYFNTFLRHSPAIKQLCHFIATSAIHHKLPRFLQPASSNESSTTLQARWQQNLKSFSHKHQQRIEQKIEDYLARLIQQQLAELSVLSNDDLEDLLRTLWDDVKDKTVYEYISKINPLDIEEFFVLVYEYWKELRQQPFIQNLVLRGVEVFYEFYRDDTLQDLFYGIGLDEQDIYTEVQRFYPKLIRVLDREGLLEPLLVNVLSPFYARSETLSLIEQHQS